MLLRPARLSRALLTLAAVLAVLATVFPVAWALQMSLKTGVEALQIPPAWLFEPRPEAYAAAWGKAGFARGVGNSLLIGLLTTVAAVVIALFAAYGFSRFRFVGDSALLFGILMTRLFPPIGIAVPYFLLLRGWGWQDTHWGLAMAYVALSLPLAIWMLKGYYDSVPVDLEHCAMIDGATRTGAALKVTLPLMAPGIAATAVFAFLTSWNEYLLASILTNRNASTLPTIIAQFVGDTGVEWPEVMAASLIALAPGLLFTFLMQRHLASGLTAGSVKG